MSLGQSTVIHNKKNPRGEKGLKSLSLMTNHDSHIDSLRIGFTKERYQILLLRKKVLTFLKIRRASKN